MESVLNVSRRLSKSLRAPAHSNEQHTTHNIQRFLVCCRALREDMCVSIWCKHCSRSSSPPREHNERAQLVWRVYKHARMRRAGVHTNTCVAAAAAAAAVPHITHTKHTHGHESVRAEGGCVCWKCVSVRWRRESNISSSSSSTATRARAHARDCLNLLWENWIFTFAARAGGGGGETPPMT